MSQVSKYIASGCLSLVFFLLSPATMAANNHANPTDNPIHFAKGSISATVTGALQPKELDNLYHFKAQKGQYAIINIRQNPSIEEIANVGMLIMPSGKNMGNKGGVVFQDCLTETGTYKLRIARNLMATQGGKAGYHAEIILLPPYASDDLCE